LSAPVRSLHAQRDVTDGVPDVLLVPGATVEIVAEPGVGALSLALTLLAVALRRALDLSSSRAWLCAVDPGSALCAPAVWALGVPLERLVVVRPPAAALLSVAVRVLRSGAFCGLVVDATGLSSLDSLPLATRRLTLAAEEFASTALVLTSPHARRRQPIPAAVRARLFADDDIVAVHIERHRFRPCTTLRWTRPPSPIETCFEETP
jgi:hypothetical protein